MVILEPGRVCVKLHGREAGRKCVIVDIIDKNFVLVTGPKELTGVRRRRTNIKHIELTPIKIDIKKGADDKEILEVIQKANQTEYLKTLIK